MATNNFKVDVSNFNLAEAFADQVLVGNSFAFIDQQPLDNQTSAGLMNFYGFELPPRPLARRVLPLFSHIQNFPGFTVEPVERPIKVAPTLLPDKEIYQAGKDIVRVLLIAPAWLILNKAVAAMENGSEPSSNPDRYKQGINLVLENNGTVYRSITLYLNWNGMVLAELGALPEGNYRLYLDEPELDNYKGDKPDCRFSSVEYVLSPLTANLMAHQLNLKILSYRLKIESYNEPLSNPVSIELWSGNQKLGEKTVKPELPGIYKSEFSIRKASLERLELRVSHLQDLATVIVPGSRKEERNETLLSGLGNEIRASLMPREVFRKVRGIYLKDSGVVNNSPVLLVDPAPSSKHLKLSWQAKVETAFLQIIGFNGEVLDEVEFNNIEPGQEVELDTPSPGGLLVIGAWIGDKAWEGWAAFLAPSEVTLHIKTPATARPGQKINFFFTANPHSSIYLVVRDNRLSGARPEEKLASALKESLDGVNQWGKSGFTPRPVSESPDWTITTHNRLRVNSQYLNDLSIRYSLALPFAEDSQILSTSLFDPSMEDNNLNARFRSHAFEESSSFVIPGKMGNSSSKGANFKQGEYRHHFADVAFCSVLETGEEGQAEIEFKLPDAVTSYSIEAFCMANRGVDWIEARESLKVSKPVWAELNLPAFIHPLDKSLASLDIGCNGGMFSLKLFCNNKPVDFQLSGAVKKGTIGFKGHRAKANFEAGPGIWKVEVEDLQNGERDASQKVVEGIGRFKVLSKRFRVLEEGNSLKCSDEILQFRLLPSLDKPFKLLCDATANYEHCCCEQTAAKLIAAVASLMSGGDEEVLTKVILAGVAREKTMFLPGKGFAMYPPQESGGSVQPNDYWGKLAAEHLISLALTGQALFSGTSSSAIKNALQEAVTMGREAAKAYKMEVIPEKINSARDAYRAVVGDSKAKSEGLAFSRKMIRSLKSNTEIGAVLQREELAYCGAALLAGRELSDLAMALEVANRLADNLDGQGRLYSTVDSTALISLLGALKESGIGSETAKETLLLIDGEKYSLLAAIKASASAQNTQVTVLKGIALAEYYTEGVEDWDLFQSNIPVSIQLEKMGKSFDSGIYKVGEMLELVIRLKQYEPGLLAHVCLPPSLAKLEGGGEVKKFTIDFKGRNETRVQLRAVAPTRPEGEHWAVLVRNMFNEEQVGNPGLIRVQVSGD